MEKIQCILFDMDGVLIPAKEWHYQAFREALNKYGFDIIPEEHAEVYDGLPTRRKLEMLTLYKGLDPELYEEIFNLKQKLTLELVEKNLQPNKSHIELLEYLKKNNFKIALCSNAIRDSIMKMLKQSCIDNYFDLIFSNQDVENPKPNPEVYIKAMREFDVRPENTLILEDSRYGLQAAYNSGAYVLKINSVDEVNLKNILEIIQSV